MREDHGRDSLWCGRLARNIAFRVFLVIAMVGAVLSSRAALAADNIILRSSARPAEAWIGQRTLLSIEVLGADGWAQITKMGELEVPGAYVMRTESQGVRLSETINRTSYTGQRYQLSVYCQRPGRLEIPGLPVTVTVKQWGATPPETFHEAVTPSTALICKVPPGAENTRGLISTTRLEADQTWSLEPTTVDLGDAVTRTIRLSADDVSGMAFPPTQYPEIDGVGIYPGQPSVADETNRGQLRGRREESVTYVFESPGTISLPAVVVNWWNPDSRRLERVELPGLEIEVVAEPAPADADHELAADPIEDSTDGLRAALLVVPIVALAVWFGGWLWRRSTEWRAARRDSEPARFRRVRTAIRRGDPLLISSTIMTWLDRLDSGPRPARLDEFLEKYGDDASRGAAASLAKGLAEGGESVRIRSLDRGLVEARRRLLHDRRRRAAADRILPGLNG